MTGVIVDRKLLETLLYAVDAHLGWGGYGTEWEKNAVRGSTELRREKEGKHRGPPAQ